MKKLTCLCLLSLAFATGCPDDGTGGPGIQPGDNNPKEEMTPEMGPAEEMTPDMGPDEEMTEEMTPDMEEDMPANTGPNLTGTWRVVKSADDANVVELTLTHETEAIPVLGTYKMADTDETGDIGNATLLNGSFSVEWFTGPNDDQKHLINMADYSAMEMTGRYISPTSGGLAEDVKLTKQ